MQPEPLSFNVAEYGTISGPIPEEILLSLKKKLINLNIKDSSLDHAKTYQELESWVEHLLETASSPKIETGHRVCAVDVLYIFFNRLGGIRKANLQCIEQKFSSDAHDNARFITIFRDYFDQATPPLLKSLKDCLTAFVALESGIWTLENRHNFSISLAKEVFNGARNGDFRKGDSYLIEFLIKKKWLPSKKLLDKGFGEGKSSAQSNVKSLFKTMESRTLAPGIGRLLGSLFRRLQEELAEKIPKENLKIEWLGFFREELAKALLSADEQVALNTELYVVPGVFHDEKEGFALFIEYLLQKNRSSRDSQNSLAIIGCLRIGKENGWLTESQIDEYVGSLGGYDSLLSDQSSMLRSHILRLMIISGSIALPFSTKYLSIFCAHFDDQFAESDPQVRNEIYAGFRILLERLIASSYALNKRLRSLQGRPGGSGADTNASNEIISIREHLAKQKAFINWFLNSLLPAQMQPNASYQRVILALKVYSFWLPQIERDARNPLPGSDLAADIKKSKKKQNEREHIVLPFDPEIQYPKLMRLFVERIMDPYDDIRTLATGLIKELPESSDLPWPYILQRSQKMIEDSGRPGQEDGFSRILEVLHDLSLKNNNISQEIWASYDLSSSEGTIIDLAFMLLDKEPYRNCENKPNRRSRIDNSVLGALALIYGRTDANLLVAEAEKRQNTLKRVLKTAQDIWVREREILCNESPEGRGVVAAISAEDSDDEEDPLSSQGFLSYSWRVVSEASSLLGAVAKFVPCGIEQEVEANHFLRSSGDLLIEQLTSIRHRGSLSSIFPALTAICYQCLMSQSQSVQALPRLWLEKLLEIVSISGKLITRRSAGLPMAIGSIVIAEIQTKKKTTVILEYAFLCLQEVVQASGTNADNAVKGGDHLELPQVHALNCMRFLFMDSQLSTMVDPYVSSSLSMAFGCFSSEIWAVRNCGIMLYTAIVKRIFPKDGTIQAVNASKFFQRYSGLDGVFLKTLADGFKDLSDHRLIEAVYPALDVISRLSFLQNEESKVFKDLVTQYLGCKIWKIRDAAAKSVLAFITTPSEAAASFKEFLNWNFGDQARDNNMINGGLCAAREIYEQRILGDEEEIQLQSERVTVDATKHYLDAGSKISPINQAYFIQLVGIVFAQGITFVRDLVIPFCQRVLEEANGSPPQTFAHSMLRKEIATIMAVVEPGMACGYLSFHDPDYGVALSEALTKVGKNVVLHRPTKGHRQSYMTKDTSSISVDNVASQASGGTLPVEILQQVLEFHRWEQYRVAASNMLLLSSEPITIEPEALAMLALSAFTEPLKESTLILLGQNLCSASKVTPKTISLMELWIEQLFGNAKDETPYSSRLATLKSIEEASKILKLGDQRIQQAFLPVWIVVHKLLNDDEDDIRGMAARLTAKLLALEEKEESVESFTPLRAERRLFAHLRRIEAFADLKVQQCIIEELIGVPIQSVGDIKQQLITANTPNTLLFKIEKQNLYRDELRCMQYHLELLSNIPEVDRSHELSEKLTQYVKSGMETLWEIAQEHQIVAGEGGVSIDEGKLRAADGFLGWTTATEEIFVLGMRVANAYSLLERWGGKDAGLEEIVLQFLEYGQRGDVKVNDAWLDAFLSN